VLRFHIIIHLLLNITSWVDGIMNQQSKAFFSHSELKVITLLKTKYWRNQELLRSFGSRQSHSSMKIYFPFCRQHGKFTLSPWHDGGFLYMQLPPIQFSAFPFPTVTLTIMLASKSHANNQWFLQLFSQRTCFSNSVQF